MKKLQFFLYLSKRCINKIKFNLKKKKRFYNCIEFHQLTAIFQRQYWNFYYPRKTLKPNLATVICTIENFFNLPAFLFIQGRSYSMQIARPQFRIAALSRISFPQGTEKLERSQRNEPIGRACAEVRGRKLTSRDTKIQWKTS